ncbi:hypothetical protein QR680_000424 [Steinernema hermaphroditum]|uniref:EamA domain-containing protein n=1 Tax=Steinernema hermaphroditum TaxID=289476 RepID=A0AA39LDK4_9BILA|nr:hypothetical protein QR680_000424 [Steinernema hermaphroditum]
MLSKKLNGLKWSLILLTAGVALVQMPSGDKANHDEDDKTSSDKLNGFLAVLAACFSSGFAGVYFEKILKGSTVSLWMRNLQLAFFSIFGGFFMCWLYDSEKIGTDGFFQGYNGVIWIVVLLQAYGGLVIALVVKVVPTTFSSFVSWLFLGDFNPTLTFLLGATIVIASTLQTGCKPRPSPAKA